MKTKFRFRVLTIAVFSLYIFWGSFGVDLTLHPDTERIPLHRVFILLTVFIFLCNTQQVLRTCLKNKLLITLILYTLLTGAWAYNPLETVKNFVFLSSALFISIMTALAFAYNRVALIRWLFWFFLFMTLASIFTALRFPNIGINLVSFLKPRWIGITTHPNALGVQALVLIWLSTNLFFLSKSKIEKSMTLFAMTAAFYAIIKADSMTSLITSFVVVISVCYYYVIGKLSFPKKLMLFTFSVFTFIFIVTFYMSTSEIADTAISSTGRDTNFTGRTLLWQKGISSAADNLIFGYGFDNLERLTRKYHLDMSHLHNGYIETLVKGGMIACVLLAIILIRTLLHQVRVKPIFKHDFIFLNTGIIMVLLHNITESSILRGLSPLSIFMLFIIVSTSLIEKNNNNKVSPIV